MFKYINYTSPYLHNVASGLLRFPGVSNQHGDLGIFFGDNILSGVKIIKPIKKLVRQILYKNHIQAYGTERNSR